MRAIAVIKKPKKARVEPITCRMTEFEIPQRKANRAKAAAMAKQSMSAQRSVWIAILTM